MTDCDLTIEQRAAVEGSFEACIAIIGAPGTGKSRALEARRARAQTLFPQAQPLAGDASAAIGILAWSVLRAANAASRPIDDVDAAQVFEAAAIPLLALEWDEFTRLEIDPEVPGLRSPARFLDSAFRLFGKLRNAGIAPASFLEDSLAAATAFYAKPPNFAHPELLHATKDTYRDSLDVTDKELARQHRREIDLSKILAKLYRTYVDRLADSGLLTPTEAVARALALAAGNPALGPTLRAEIGYACLDDAQELGANDLALLRAIFGDELTGVTFAGDASSTLGSFRGARPEATFASASQTFMLRAQVRSPIALELAARQLCASHEKPDARDVEPALHVHRAKSPQHEAVTIAEWVRARLAEGTPANRIALLFRSVCDVHAYESALLDREIPSQTGGDFNVFTDPRALDALALLWNVWDPFRHDWMLRTLSIPPMALSDSTLALLCSEPSDNQTTLLLSEADAAPLVRPSRWDPKRHVRLGWNVTRGDRDADLNEIARARVRHFRDLRNQWIAALGTQPLDRWIERVWNDGLARAGAPGSARALAQEHILASLHSRLCALLPAMPGATLGDLLESVALRAESTLETSDTKGDERFVRILSIDAARGLEFDHVVIADARAGSFPRWYVPDTFLFSPKYGIVPKDNVGDATAARTAKFTYYMHRSKARDHYNAQERRAFIYALRRARKSALVTASGRATRGVTAPEFLEELRAVRLPGTVVI